MEISMNEVVIHEHLEKYRSSVSGDFSVEHCFVLFIIVDGNTWDILLDEDGFSWDNWWGEPDNVAVFELFVESKQIASLYIEVYLVDEEFLQWIIGDWDLEKAREFRKDSRGKEDNIDVTLDILLNIWVSDLYCYFFILVNCFVDLTNRSDPNRDRVKTIKHLFYLFSELAFEYFLSYMVLMGRRFLSEIDKLVC